MAPVAVSDFEIEASRKERVFAGRNVVLQVGQAEATAPFVISILDDRYRDSRDVGGSHELADGSLDLRPLFWGELVFLGVRIAGKNCVERDS
jgi:hypothetical protein